MAKTCLKCELTCFVKAKFETYWPTGALRSTLTVDDFTVKLHTKQEYADFAVRKMSLLHQVRMRSLLIKTLPFVTLNIIIIMLM